MRPEGRHRAPFLAAVAVLWITALAVKAFRAGGNALDSAPSVIGGLTLPLCFLLVPRNPRRRDIAWSCAWSVVLLVLAELVELYITRGTFDVMDIAGGCAGTLVTALGALALFRK